MTSVAEIINAVKDLSEEDKGLFIARLAEIDFNDACGIVRSKLTWALG